MRNTKRTILLGIAICLLAAVVSEAGVYYGHRYVRLRYAYGTGMDWNFEVSVNSYKIPSDRQVYVHWQNAEGVWKTRKLDRVSDWPDHRSTYFSQIPEDDLGVDPLKFRILVYSKGNWFVDDNDGDLYVITAGDGAVGGHVSASDIYRAHPYQGYILTDVPDGEPMYDAVYCVGWLEDGRVRTIPGVFRFIADGIAYWNYDLEDGVPVIYYVACRDCQGNWYLDDNFTMLYRR